MNVTPAKREQLGYWRGYAQGLTDVLDYVAEMPPKSLTPSQKRLVEELSDEISEHFPEKEQLKATLTNAQLAKKYVISPRTVTNWRKAGCEFEYGQARVIRWSVEQRLLPDGFKAKFARQIEARRERERQCWGNS